MADIDLTPWKKGDKFSASHLNEAIDLLRTVAPQFAAQGQITSPSGTSFFPKNASAYKGVWKVKIEDNDVALDGYYNGRIVREIPCILDVEDDSKIDRIQGTEENDNESFEQDCVIGNLAETAPYRSIDLTDYLPIWAVAVFSEMWTADNPPKPIMWVYLMSSQTRTFKITSPFDSPEGGSLKGRYGGAILKQWPYHANPTTDLSLPEGGEVLGEDDEYALENTLEIGRTDTTQWLNIGNFVEATIVLGASTNETPPRKIARFSVLKKGGATPSTADGTIAEVAVASSGGSNSATSTSTATYTYDWTDPDGINHVGTSPSWQRPVGELTGPGTRGMIKKSGIAWTLLFTDEQPSVSECTGETG